MRFVFEWDPVKAERNLSKHGVSFDAAMSIFSDPLALTIFDADHNDEEDRWITIGRAGPGNLLLAIHTHVEMAADEMLIRIISARRPTRKEVRVYEQESVP